MAKQGNFLINGVQKGLRTQILGLIGDWPMDGLVDPVEDVDACSLSAESANVGQLGEFSCEGEVVGLGRALRGDPLEH